MHEMVYCYWFGGGKNQRTLVSTFFQESGRRQLERIQVIKDIMVSNSELLNGVLFMRL